MSVTKRQFAYLKAMGIPVWVSHDAVKVLGTDTREVPDTAIQADSSSLSQAANAQAKSSHPADILNALDNTPTENPAQLSSVAEVSKQAAPVVSENIIKQCEDFDLSKLHSMVSQCQLCELHAGRTQTVFGDGQINARWMIIGDTPKEEEDIQGVAFAGRSAQLLNNMLAAVGLQHADVYMTNVLKCRPPNNRDPHQNEIQACHNYLLKQIELVQPSLVLIVGRIAAQHLLKTHEPLARLRGKPHTIEGVTSPVVVTYHPAYLLRQPRDKSKSWQDLKLASSLLKQ